MTASAPTIQVANKYHGRRYPGATVVTIMRPSPLGNPYSHLDGTLAEFKVATREDAVRAFAPWLDEQLTRDTPAARELARLTAIAQRENLVLLCCCEPAACHAHIVRWMIARRLGRDVPTPPVLLTQSPPAKRTSPPPQLTMDFGDDPPSPARRSPGQA